MEFVPLRSLQRGEIKIREALKRENNRVILTNNGQPAYLLIDLAGKDIISLINLIDRYNEEIEEDKKRQIK